VPGSAPPDRDSNRSDYLFAERAYDENNEPILEAEYWGYDDKQTPEDETDDEHLYFIRWYVLRDSLDTSASSGTIRLYDPELNPVYSWDITALRCLEHNEATDGLRASAGGIKHGVIVPVPVSVMQLGGEYRFLLQVKDDHVAQEKAHRLKPALAINALIRPRGLVLIVDKGVPDDIITENDFWEILRRAGSTFGHGYQFAAGLGIYTLGAIWDLIDPQSALGSHQLTEPQKQYAKQWAAARGVEPFVVTIGQIQRTHPLYAYYVEGSGNGSVDNPVAIKMLLPNVTEKVQNGEWTKEQAIWALANSLIHELTHALSRSNKHHGPSTPRCVYEDSFAQHFLVPICNWLEWGPANHRRQGELPWHKEKEANDILRFMGWWR
jgi:hypothetical protein